MAITKFIVRLILLNLYPSDLLDVRKSCTQSADDTGPTFAEFPHVLFADMTKIEEYCCPSPIRPITCLVGR